MEVGGKREAISQETGIGVLLCTIVCEPMIKTKDLSGLSETVLVSVESIHVTPSLTVNIVALFGCCGSFDK